METRSRKRAAANSSSSAAPSSSSKRARSSTAPAAAPRTRRSTPAMDPSPSSRRRARAAAASSSGKDPTDSSNALSDSDSDSDALPAPFPPSPPRVNLFNSMKYQELKSILKGKDGGTKKPELARRADSEYDSKLKTLRRPTLRKLCDGNKVSWKPIESNEALVSKLMNHKKEMMEYESAAKSMRELLSEKDIQITELKKELTDMKECSHEKFLVAEDTPVELKNDIHLSNELVADEVSEDSVHGCGKKALVEQSEEELSSDIKVEEIQNDADIEEMKHHDCPSSSQEANSDTEALSCSHAFVELKAMGAAEKNLEESVSGRYKPTVEENIAERDAVGGHRRAGVKDHADLSALVLDEGPPQTKTSTAPVKGCRQAAEATAGDKENCPAAQVITADKKEKRQAGGIGTDKKEGREAAGVIAADDKKEEVDLCASFKPSQNTKKTRRRLLPVSSMMLKEFTGPYIDAAIADPKKRAAADGRSEKLIQLLKARPPTKLR